MKTALHLTIAALAWIPTNGGDLTAMMFCLVLFWRYSVIQLALR